MGSLFFYQRKEQRKMSMIEWARKEVELACNREAPDIKPDEWDYGCACYESALKAYESLFEDGHSGMSISITKSILNRLLEGKPLTPIEDTDDAWADDRSRIRNDVKTLQCKRMSSLFKYVYSDGTIKYSDVNRMICVDMDNPRLEYYSKLVRDIIDEMFPITMPYTPGKPFRVFCKDFLADEKNWDFDTVGVYYAIKEGIDGPETIDIYRYFGEKNGKFVEIDAAEYQERENKSMEIRRALECDAEDFGEEVE